MHGTPALPKESNAETVSLGVPRANRRPGEVGKVVSGLSANYGVAGATIHRWLDQDRINHGKKPGTTSTQNTELAAARKRIRKLEHELELIRKAAAIFDEQEKIRPKGTTRLAGNFLTAAS